VKTLDGKTVTVMNLESHDICPAPK
jgi:hypothetical protein